jgi:type I restriction enzyme S subunit
VRESTNVTKRKLPPGWRWAKLGEVCQVIGGSTPSTGNSDYWDGDIVWVTPTDLGKLDGQVISSSSRRITSAGYQSCGTQILPPGTVVMSSRAPIGHVGIAGVPLSTNQGCKSFVPGPDVDSVFLYWSVKRVVPNLQALGSGATFTEISKSHLQQFEILLPPLDEQRRIAAILREQMAAVERARAAAQAQLDVAKTLPAAYLSRVFNSHEARSWQRKRLNEICEISTGTTPSRSRPEYFGDGTPWVKPGDFDGFLYISSSREFLTPLGVSEGRGRTFPKGSVLLVCIGATVGKVAIASNVISANQQINVLICGDSVLSEYLYFHLRFDRSDFIAAAASVTLPIINQERLGAREIPLPPIAEQRRIASILNEQIASAENLRVGLEEQLAEIKVLPAALLCQAFAGEL